MDEVRCLQLAHGRSLLLDCARIFAILNVTPDSFSDGGRYDDVDRAVSHAVRCLDAGADVIDVGGESTRPGAERVGVEEQIGRVLPVVEGLLAKRPKALVSVDTTLCAVAEAVISAGGHVINDVSAGLEDPDLFHLATETGAGLVLMHRLHPPGGDVFSHEYQDGPEYEGGVVERVRSFLEERVASAEGVGVRSESIVIDPGFGFGKTVEQNFEMSREIGTFVEMGYPVLSAVSRKSFIGEACGVAEPTGRVAGTVAVSVAHFLAGVQLFRVHDVLEHRHALDVIDLMSRC